MAVHIDSTHTHITAVRCKGCGTTIMQLLPVDEVKPQERRAGTVIIREIYVTLRQNNMYREATIITQLPNGKLSQHITHMCSNCKSLLTHSEDSYLVLKRWMDQDIDELAERGVPPEHIALWKGQQVIGVKL